MASSPASPILVIDGTGLLVRCNRAGRRTAMFANGVRTGPLVLFINSVAKLIRIYRPHYVLVALDGLHARDWRRSLAPSYKTNRPDPPAKESDDYQLALSFLGAAGIGFLSYDGYEADDVIAYVWKRRSLDKASRPVVIASDDADLHQLIGDGVYQVPLNGLSQQLDEFGVRDRYGCEPRRLPLLRAVMGDVSDNVPGIPGVGPYRALKLLTAAQWSLGRIEHKWLMEIPSREADLAVAYGIFDLRGSINSIMDQPGMKTYPLWKLMAWEDESTPPLADHRDPTELLVFLHRYQLASVSQRLEAGRLW